MEEEGLRVDGLNTGNFDYNLELASNFNDHIEENEEEDINGEEEYDYDDEEEEEEETYTFRFGGDIDPLALTEDDAFGVQPYERLERMENEYEALAAKKRKQNLNYNHEGMPPKKKLRQEDLAEANFEDLMAEMTGNKRKSKKIKKRGRRKGSKNKISPEITHKLGEATLHYVHGRYDKAIPLLKELIMISPYLPEIYHTLALIYKALGDKKKSVNFYMLALYINPKDAHLWKLLVTWSLELNNRGQARHCLERAIRHDPEDMGLRYLQASLFLDLGEDHKAAESYEQIWKLRPMNLEALKKAAKLYQKCDHHERGINILEDYLIKNPKEADMSIVHLLASILLSKNAHEKALHHIEYANQTYSAGKELPIELLIQMGICHAHLGYMEKAEAFFSVFTQNNVNNCSHLIMEVGTSLMGLNQHEVALKYYTMIEGTEFDKKADLYYNMGNCYSFLNARTQAIDYFYKALHENEDNNDCRLDLVSLLLEENKEDEAISVLSPPDSEVGVGEACDKGKQWWMEGKIKLRLCYIYKSKGMIEAFVEAIFPLVHQTLLLETIQRKVRHKKKLSKSELYKRVQVLNESQTDNVFQGFRPIASSADLSKAARAKRLLEKIEFEKKQKQAAALANGEEWQSDDSDDETPVYREPPLPNLLKDEEQLTLIIYLCKGLVSLQRYWEALEIVNLSLKFAHNTLTTEKKEEIRSLGAQISCNIDGPSNGWDCARYIISQNPYSFAAWNCYYKIMSRSRPEKHSKFLHEKAVKHEDCVPVNIIKGHHFTMISQHQAAARYYLKAYKLMPDNPLINLCAGTALINLALGFRLHNKHQCVLQGLSFLYNNLRLSGNNQEALYNIARAYHHVGLISLAATYYEKVLAMYQKDYPIPKLPSDAPEAASDLKPGYCDLRREAAYNLHLIYKSSGAIDLARQVLRDHCSI